jgi:hypothetical protein
MFSMEQSPFEAGRMNSRGPGKREAVCFPRLVGSDPTFLQSKLVARRDRTSKDFNGLGWRSVYSDAI